ncbi:MAG: hypothetical protein AB1483_04230 [Candidatus Zixiibacteriota bacterium]
MRLFRKNRGKEIVSQCLTDRLAARVRAPEAEGLATTSVIKREIKWQTSEVAAGRHRMGLYRFLSDNVPIISACVSTWVRLSAAPGRFTIEGGHKGGADEAAERLERLSESMWDSAHTSGGSLIALVADLFTGLYRDGVFGGFLTVKRDESGVDKFISIDSSDLAIQIVNGRPRLVLEGADSSLDLERPDFYFVPLNSDISRPLGKSILQSVPFVSFIEQQLVDDMRRSSHNSGYHRLHVKVTPPERMSGESEQAYIERVNSYFDSTVSMIKSCRVDENPVTWDNIAIEYIGPNNVRTVTNSWFVNHRSMIEEICCGTNLAPFLLGYSYGATTSWSSFKFDLVMRQVKSVQAQMASFLEWIGNIDLALGGFKQTCRWQFDNTFAYQANEKAEIESSRIGNILKLFEAGLIDKKTAQERAGELL